MPALINWELLKQPYNWVVVILMCAFGLFALALIFPQEQASEN